MRLPTCAFAARCWRCPPSSPSLPFPAVDEGYCEFRLPDDDAAIRVAFHFPIIPSPSRPSLLPPFSWQGWYLYYSGRSCVRVLFPLLFFFSFLFLDTMAPKKTIRKIWDNYTSFTKNPASRPSSLYSFPSPPLPPGLKDEGRKVSARPDSTPSFLTRSRKD